MRVVAMHNAPPATTRLRRREPTWTPELLKMARIVAQAKLPPNKQFKCRISSRTAMMTR